MSRRLITRANIVNNSVLKNLTLNDFGFWSGSTLVTVIFSLFVIDQIPGATVTDAGIASMIFTIVSALVNIPLGNYMDKKKGLVDETVFLSLSSIIRGIALIYMAYTSTLTGLYLVQIVLGIAKGLNTTAWRVLFNKFLDEGHKAAQFGVYETVMSFGMGIAAFLSGYIADKAGYDIVMIIAGIMTLISTVFPLLSIKDIKAKV